MTLDEILAVPVHGTISRSRRRVNFGLFWFPPSRHRRRLGFVAASVSLLSVSRRRLGFVVVLVFAVSAWSGFGLSCDVSLGSVSVLSPSSFLSVSWPFSVRRHMISVVVSFVAASVDSLSRSRRRHHLVAVLISLLF